MRRSAASLIAADRLAGFVLLAVAGVAIREGVRLHEGVMGSGFPPLLAGLLLVPLALSQLVRPDRDGAGAPASSAEAGARPAGRVVWVFLILGLYVVALRPLGFGVATALFLAALFHYLGRYPLPVVLAAAGVAATVVTAVFRRALSLPLPVGPWGF